MYQCRKICAEVYLHHCILNVLLIVLGILVGCVIIGLAIYNIFVFFLGAELAGQVFAGFSIIGFITAVVIKMTTGE